MTQKQQYINWFENAKKNEKLIDIKFQIGDIKLSSQEEFYREANHFNEQMANQSIKPLYEVNF